MFSTTSYIKANLIRGSRGTDEPSASLSHLLNSAIIVEGDLNNAAGGVIIDKIARFETGKWLLFCSDSKRQA